MTRLLAAIIVVIVLACGAIIFLLENPSRFKSQIAQLAQQATGYQVDINGTLSWRYWPPIAIQAELMTLSANDGVFAEFDRIEVDVDLLPLLTGQRALNVERIAMSGGNVDIRVNEQGTGNWTPSASRAPSNGGEPPMADESLIPSLQALEIQDVNILYDNRQTGETYTATLTNLRTGSVKANTPFDASASITLMDASTDTEVAVSTSGRIWVNDDGIRAGFEALVTRIDAKIEGKTWPSATLTSSGEFRADNNIITLKQLDLQTQYLQAAFTGLLNLSGESPRAAGTLHIESAAPGKFAELLDMDLPISSLLLDSDVAATTTAISFKSFEGRFDESTVKGSIDYRAADRPAIKAEVRVDQLNLDETGAAAGTAASSDDSGTGTDTEIIPVNALQGLDIAVIARIEKLTMQGYQLSQAKVEINSQNERMETIANATVFGGKVVMTANTTLDQPVLTTMQVSMDQFDVTSMTEWESLTGKLTGTASLRFTGHRMSDLDSSLSGKTVFNVIDGELDVRAVKNLAQIIDLIRDKRSSLSDWPDRMPFERMDGQHLFNQGLKQGQVLTARVDNLSIAAVGGFDLANETMAWDVTTLFEQTDTGNFRVSKQISGIRWPLTCTGPMDAGPAALCFSQEGAIGHLVADIVQQDVKRRGSEKIDEIIEDKVPEQFRELTRDIFKDMFKKP